VEGKTEPRGLRHFPHYDADDGLDEAHVRNALQRIPQSHVPDSAKTSALAHVRKHASSLGIDVSKAYAMGEDVDYEPMMPALEGPEGDLHNRDLQTAADCLLNLVRQELGENEPEDARWVLDILIQLIGWATHEGSEYGGDEAGNGYGPGAY